MGLEVGLMNQATTDQNNMFDFIIITSFALFD
jgi:hypothetical protein